ncbi:MAG: hypothetical protein Ct9H300mP28_31940 [Pseudomonadota bacterium]|nr:MAG: hypothetical protein Ct9H300mP28_31940 [Pseudomonadota bacterium]
MTTKKLFFFRPDFLEPEVDPQFDIIYEDKALFALCKSGNLPTSPSGKYYKNTLVNLVKSLFWHKKMYTLHGLDRETSGVLFLQKGMKLLKLWPLFSKKKQLKKFTCNT